MNGKRRILVLVIGVLGIVAFDDLVVATAGQDAVVHEGSNVEPNPGDVGERPYEMIGRQEARTPLMTFEDCSQWDVDNILRYLP